MVSTLLMVADSSFGVWSTVASNVVNDGHTGGPFPNVTFQTHDDQLILDYVVVKDNLGNILFEDDFSGATGTGPDGAKWNAEAGWALKNGLGQLVLTPTGPWAESLAITGGAMTWGTTNVSVEMHAAFGPNNGAPGQHFLGFGVAPMFAYRSSFAIKDLGDPGGDIDVQTNFGPGIDTGLVAIRDGVTIQGFRITRDANSAATYEYNPLIPEPITLSLLGFGSLGVMLRRKKN